MPTARAACAASSPGIWSLGSWVWGRVEFSRGEKLVKRAARVHVCCACASNSLAAPVRSSQHLEPVLEVEVFRDFQRGAAESSFSGFSSQPAVAQDCNDTGATARRSPPPFDSACGGHVDAVRDAMAVSDDQRRAVVRLRFQERLQRVLVLGAHGDGGDVNIPVGHCDQPEVFLAERVCRRRRILRRRRAASTSNIARRCWNKLPCREQDLNVATAGQDVVEAAVTNVVGPAVATDDPDALPNERSRPVRAKFGSWNVLTSFESLLSAPRRVRRWSKMPASSRWSRIQELRSAKIPGHCGCKLLQQFLGEFLLLVE